MVAKVYEKLWPESRPPVPFEEVRELLVMVHGTHFKSYYPR